MADLSATPPRLTLAKIDKAWIAILLIPVLVWIFDRPETLPVIQFAGKALLGTLPFITFAVLAVAYMKATGAETLLAKAFEGRETRMIVLAALLGGLSPFCSCEVIPFIAALLAVGAPLSAVMAFWLSSPLMDPAMYAITAGALGFEFATAKIFAAVGMGLFGGFAVKALAGSAITANPLREKPAVGGCCGVKKPFQGAPVWRFWGEAARVETFRDTALENAIFLLKWLILAYLIEALMIQYVPAETIGRWLGGEGVGPVLLAALIGAPAYLNGYAAPALVEALITQGMTHGAGMAFMVAGGVSSIPAAIAVWALVKPRIFSLYLGLAMVGAVTAGLAWNVIA